MDTWADASGPEKAIRFADGETVRWADWGANCYFRLLFGLTLGLFGAAIALTAILPRWIGWVGGLAGLLYMATGVAVGYSGFESGFGDATGDAVQLLFAVFVIGFLVAAVRRRDPATRDAPI